MLLAEEKEVCLSVQAQHAATVRHVLRRFVPADVGLAATAFEWHCQMGHHMRSVSLVEEALSHPLSALIAVVGAGEIEEVQEFSIEDLGFVALFLYRPSHRPSPHPAVQAKLRFEVVPDCSMEATSLAMEVDGNRAVRSRKPAEVPGERCIEDWHFHPCIEGEAAESYRLKPEVLHGEAHRNMGTDKCVCVIRCRMILCFRASPPLQLVILW